MPVTNSTPPIPVARTLNVFALWPAARKLTGSNGNARSSDHTNIPLSREVDAVPPTNEKFDAAALA